MTGISITLIGGPTALIDYQGTTFLTDPTFDPPGEYPIGPNEVLRKLTGPALPIPGLPELDAILLSHDEHPDNLDEFGRLALARATDVFSTPGAATRIEGVTGLKPWESANVKGTLVTAVPALHGPQEFGNATVEAKVGEVVGFVLEAPGAPTVYVSGDNASLQIVEAVAAGFPDIAVAVLFTGAARTELFDGKPLTLTAAQAVEAAKLMPDAVVVPVHSEGWAHFSEGNAELQASFESAGLAARLVLPVAGEPLEL